MTDTTETRPFDLAAAEEVLRKLQDLQENDSLPILLRVRAPDDRFDLVLDDCYQEIIDSATALRTSISEYDSYIDKTHGVMRVRANAHLGRALIQRDDLFWHVGWDSDRWR